MEVWRVRYINTNMTMASSFPPYHGGRVVPTRESVSFIRNLGISLPLGDTRRKTDAKPTESSVMSEQHILALNK